MIPNSQKAYEIEVTMVLSMYGLKVKINQEGDHTSEPCGKNPLMKPKDWYAPNAGIWQNIKKEASVSLTVIWRLLHSLF